MYFKIIIRYLAICLLGLYLFPAMGMEAEEDERRWDQPGIPHRGWQHVGVEVLPQATGVCEMCAQTHIRYMHTVQHPDYDNLQVGCVCAEKMCEDYVNPKAQERQAKNRVARERAAANREAERVRVAQARAIQCGMEIQNNWLDISNWNQKANGNYSRKLGDGWITLFSKNNGWKYVYDNNFSDWHPNIQSVLQTCYNAFQNVILNARY